MTTANRFTVVALCLTYALYFGQLGVLTPYLGVFLDGRGFSSAEIGELFAVISLARIVGPSLWASIADKTGKSLGILRLGSVLTVCSFAGVFWSYSFWHLTLSMGLMMMFWTAVLPQLEVLSLRTVEGDSKRYGRIRLWGSIGYIVLTVSVGQALDYFSSDTPIYASMLVLSALCLSIFMLREPTALNQLTTQTTGAWHYLRTKVVVIFLLVNWLLQVSFGAYYGFFALYMRDLGYSGVDTGLLIAWGVVVEVGIFLIAQALIARFGIWSLLLFCAVATAIRWWMLGELAHYFWIVFLSQCIHAVSFGLNHSTSMHFIHHYFPTHVHSRIQGVYIGFAFGLGGATGNFVAGQLWQQGSGAYTTFAAASLCIAIGAVLLLFIKPSSMNTRA